MTQTRQLWMLTLRMYPVKEYKDRVKSQVHGFASKEH